jgi:DNA primase
MARIPEETLERVRDSSDIVDVVGAHVELRQRGNNWSGLCPFHEEKTPSFNVNAQRQIYHCFGCGVGGDVFKFVQEIDRVSFMEAVTFLAERAAIDLPKQQGHGEEDRLDPLFRAHDLATKYYHHMIRQPEGSAALEYLRRRGLTDEVIDHEQLGYAPAGWTSFLEVAGRRHFSPDVLSQSGLVSPSRRGQGHYDRFRQRIIFPISNLSGRVIAFGARAMSDEDEPKYLNSPETPIYHKSRVLYGLSRSREPIRRSKTALVVEGYMDVLSLIQAGVENVVAASGTALTADHAQLLGRYADRVVLIFDGDAAGSNAAVRGIDILLKTDLDVRVVTLPDGQDPDSLVRESGKEALDKLVDTAPAALDVYLDHMVATMDVTSVQGRRRAIEQLLPLLGDTTETVKQDLMLRRVSQRFGVGETALRQEVEQSIAQRAAADKRQHQRQRQPATGMVDSAPPIQQPLPPPTVAHRLERQFAALLLQFPQYIGPTMQRLTVDEFTDPFVIRLVALLKDRFCNVDRIEVSALVSELGDDPLGQLVATCALEEFDEAQARQLWLDHWFHLRRKSLTRQIDDTTRRLRQAQEAGLENEVRSLNAHVRELINSRTALTDSQNQEAN